MKSLWFDDVKKYFDMNLYSKEDVAVFVLAEMITEEEYKLITGDDYVA